MNKNEVSESTIDALKKAGWYEGRKNNIDNIVTQLEEKGFEVFDAARKFYEEFDELVVITSDETRYTFDISEMIDYMTPVVFNLDDRLDEKTMYIGYIQGHEMYMYITESGKIICPTAYIGDDAWEAFDSLFSYNHKNHLSWSNYYERENFVPNKYRS